MKFEDESVESNVGIFIACVFLFYAVMAITFYVGLITLASPGGLHA